MKVAIIASVLATSAFAAICGNVGKRMEGARVRVVLEQIETDGLVVEYN